MFAERSDPSVVAKTGMEFEEKKPKTRSVRYNNPCLLYTSDAADDLLCVDLGGRGIIKKKTTHIAYHDI